MQNAGLNPSRIAEINTIRQKSSRVYTANLIKRDQNSYDLDGSVLDGRVCGITVQSFDLVIHQ
jgi:hypothetical protein